uniref:leukocyte cysteine proteinase inhibitor 1-like n=1 Tax=Pristiophorus japonicus TaxID=55135 RepID=UPI00398F33A8
MQQSVLGGMGPTVAVTVDIQKLVQSLKADVEKELDRKCEIFHALSYQSQVVSGTNYFIKVVVGDGDDYIHVSIYQPLPHTNDKPTVTGVQRDKKLSDKIESF